MNEFFYAISLLYILTALFVWLGLARRWPEASGGLRSASVIICARDEECDLPACLESLEHQVLDPGCEPLEVILVDDVSGDRTALLMEQYSTRSRHRVKILHMPPSQEGEPSGKWRPLKEGMRLASGEALLLTDADAILPPGWAAGHMRELGSAQMAAGFALLEGQGLWGRVQSLDWLFLLEVGSSMNRWGRPQGALGKNLSVRRKEYLAAGGLEAAGFSLTEDLALIQLMQRAGATMRFPLNREIMISTPSAHTWGEFVRQRKRWASGIRRLDPVGRGLIVLMAMRNIAVVAGVLSGLPHVLEIWGVTALGNLLIQWRTCASLGILRRLAFFPLWEIFYAWSAPVMAVSILVKPTVAWKDRKFEQSGKSVPAA